MEYRDLPIRKNARVVLLNRDSEILLMKVTLPDRSFWCTLGGGIEADETPQAAAYREVYEEAGYRQRELEGGQVIWKGRHILMRHNTPVLMDEIFLMFKVHRTDFSTINQTDEERQVVDQLRWWPVEEILNTSETIVPPRLGIYLQQLIEQGPPDQPQVVNLGDLE